MRRSATLDLRNLPWGGPIPFAGEPGVVQIWEWELAVKVQWIRKYCNFAMAQHRRIYIYASLFLFSGDFGARHYCHSSILRFAKMCKTTWCLLVCNFLGDVMPGSRTTRHDTPFSSYIAMNCHVCRNNEKPFSGGIALQFSVNFLAKDLHPFEHDPLDWSTRLLFPKPEPSAGGVQHGRSNETTPFRFLLLQMCAINARSTMKAFVRTPNVHPMIEATQSARWVLENSVQMNNAQWNDLPWVWFPFWAGLLYIFFSVAPRSISALRANLQIRSHYLKTGRAQHGNLGNVGRESTTKCWWSKWSDQVHYISEPGFLGGSRHTRGSCSTNHEPSLSLRWNRETNFTLPPKEWRLKQILRWTPAKSSTFKIV